jgi:hypothetical protein
MCCLFECECNRYVLVGAWTSVAKRTRSYFGERTKVVTSLVSEPNRYNSKQQTMSAPSLSMRGTLHMRVKKGPMFTLGLQSGNAGRPPSPSRKPGITCRCKMSPSGLIRLSELTFGSRKGACRGRKEVDKQRSGSGIFRRAHKTVVLSICIFQFVSYLFARQNTSATVCSGY